MFVISKLFWIAAQPLSLAFIFTIVGLFAAILHWRRTGLACAALGAAILFLTIYTSLGAYVLQGLEARFPKPSNDPESVSCMIVLGGAFETEVTTSRGGIEFNQSADRFVEALRLAVAFPSARIIVSGGDGSLSGAYEGDAVASARFFETFGIEPARLIEERLSRTTYENARNLKAALAEEGLHDCLLITSAYHMPRSIGLFRANGIAVHAWPTDYRTSGNVVLGFDFTQPSSNAQLASTAMREWTGLLAYYLAGRIDTLYPAP